MSNRSIKNSLHFDSTFVSFASINAIQLILSIFSLPPYTSHSSPLLSLYSKSNYDSGNELYISSSASGGASKKYIFAF